jgi:predicted Rossmann fold flavoprotein
MRPSILSLITLAATTLIADASDQPVNWLPDTDVPAEIRQLRQTWGKRQIHTRSPFEQIPKRLWNALLTAAQISAHQTWSHLTKTEQESLVNQLTNAQFPVDGKSTNKEEFVTCGGVQLRDIDMKTMQSKICPGLYFAGEIMDIDGITGGFNFQNAWTSAHHAGTASAGLPTSQHFLPVKMRQDHSS